MILDVGDYAIPCGADWNGYGRKELLVGYQTASKVALYLNSGSDANPAFTPSVNLQAGGVYFYRNTNTDANPILDTWVHLTPQIWDVTQY